MNSPLISRVRRCLAIGLLAIASAAAAQPSWRDLGPQPITRDVGLEAALLLGPQGNPYFAYASKENSHIVVLGGSAVEWTPIGQPFGNPTTGFSMALHDGKLYVASGEGSYPSDQKLRVYRCDLSTAQAPWEPIATTGLVPGGFPLLGAGGGKLYLAYRVSRSSARVAVYNAKTATWDKVGEPFSNGQSLDLMCLQFGEDGSPYLGYRSDIYYLTVRHYTNESWATLTPNVGLSPYGMGSNWLAARGGAVYLVAEGVWNGKVNPAQVYKYSGGTQWTPFGAPFAESDIEQNVRANVFVSPDGTVYLVRAVSGNNTIEVQRWNPTTSKWEPVADPNTLSTTSWAFFTTLAFPAAPSQATRPILGFRDWYQPRVGVGSGKYQVKQLTPTSAP